MDVAARGSGAVVVLAGGTSIEADKVLLATGNQPPMQLASAAAFHHPRYVENPWEEWENRLPDPGEPIVMLGAGLTMVDAFLTLKGLRWQGPMIAVSRHGLLPLSHFKGIEYADFPPPDIATLRLPALVDLVEEHCLRLKGLGANPAIVVDKLRPHTQRIWQKLSLDEKREFCRRYSTRWNVTRHRIAQLIHEQVAAALADGSLQVVKGCIRDLRSAGERISVVVEDAHQRPQTMEGGLVINCTGPQASLSATTSPLLQNVLRQGLAQVDELDMGLCVEADFAVVDRSGDRSAFLFAMGPLLKGTLWETTAVPELRGQAFRVAQALLNDLSAEHTAQEAWPSQADVDVLEYCI